MTVDFAGSGDEDYTCGSDLTQMGSYTSALHFTVVGCDYRKSVSSSPSDRLGTQPLPFQRLQGQISDLTITPPLRRRGTGEEGRESIEFLEGQNSITR